VEAAPLPVRGKRYVRLRTRQGRTGWTDRAPHLGGRESAAGSQLPGMVCCV